MCPHAPKKQKDPCPLLLPLPPSSRRLIIILCCPCSPIRPGDTERASLAGALADIASSSSREPTDTCKDSTDNLSAACGESSRTSSTELEEAMGEAGVHAEAGETVEPEEHRAVFELLIASDVIYSVSVVAPLFHTVSSLLSRGEGPTGRRRSISSGEEPKEGRAPTAEWSAARCDDNGNDSTIAASAVTAGPSPRRGGDIPGVDLLPDGVGSAAAAASATAAVVFPQSDNASACIGKHSTGGGGEAPVPVFVMSQSFGYDPETERAIGQACAEFGLLREIVWDELPPAAAHVGGQVITAEAGADGFRRTCAALVAGEQDGDNVLHGGSAGANSAEAEGGGLGGVGAGGSAAAEDVSLLVSQRWRKGTKMQRFWRCA